jgi:uncharacterized membrane protein YcfT
MAAAQTTAVLLSGGGGDGANGRIDWIDTAKAISILLVTLYHAALLGAAADLPVYKAVTLNIFLAPIRMPLFFATAGVFAGSIIAKPWPVLLHRRVALYAWLFVVWSIFRWCSSAFVVRNPAAPTEGSHLSEIGWAILMPTTGLWFLWSLGLFFVVAKLLSAMPRKLGIAIAVIASLIVMTAVANRQDRDIPDLLENIAHRNSILYFVFFYTAAVAPQLIRSLGNVRLWRSLAICAGVFAVATLAIRAADVDIIVGIARFAASIAGVAALLLFSRLIDRVEPVARLMHYIGRNTLPIYVAQVPLIALFTTFLSWAGAARLGTLANALMVVEVVAVVVAALALRFALLKGGAAWFYELPSVRRRPLNGSPRAYSRARVDRPPT